MKNIVVLSLYHYPDMAATAAVFDKFIQSMKGKYTFHVITVSWYTDIKPLNDPYVKVYYVYSFMHRLRAQIESKYRQNGGAVYGMLVKMFRLRTYVLWNTLYPSATKWQIKAMYKKLKELYSIINIDAVISVSGAIDTQFAARLFKTDHPEIKWITFFTDPFTNSGTSYPPLRNKKRIRDMNFLNQLDIFNKADFNYMLKGLYDYAINDFKQPKEKTFILTYTMEDIRARVNGTIIDDKECTHLVYAGRLYNFRNPEYMLSMFSKINSIKLDLYVFQHDCDSIVDKYVSDKIKRKGVVERRQYEKMICYDYDILVSIGNNCSDLLPSKMYEYLSTGRPIINFYYLNDAQYDLIEKYPLGINIKQGDEKALSTIEAFCRDMKGKSLTFEEVEELYPELSLKKQVTILEKLINA